MKSLLRFLPLEESVKIESGLNGVPGLKIFQSRSWGGIWALEQLWETLGIKSTLQRILKNRGYRTPIERAIFSMVANRALAPLSKLSVSEWAVEDVFISELDKLPVQQLYRAMDFIMEAQESLQYAIYDQIANLLNLEVDLLYFDTTSSYFETDQTDEDGEIRQYGHSKDHLKDRPQVIIGLAVTRDGIPIRCWSWPGNTSDQSVISEVKQDLIGWKLGRVVTVVDRGMVSEENLRILQRAGGHYIAGVKLRSGQSEVKTALSKRGRFTEIRNNLYIKEVTVGDGESRQRFVLVYNPHEAKKQRENREKMLISLEEQLRQLKVLDGSAHSKAHCQLISHPVYGRYLRIQKDGELKIDLRKVRDETFLDGKYLLTTSDDTLKAADVALGYKQLLQVENAFRTLKTDLNIRSMYHYKPERIKAHIVICWLALLLVRVSEERTLLSWNKIRKRLNRIHLSTLKGRHGTIRMRTELTKEQKSLFHLLKIKNPPHILEITTN